MNLLIGADIVPTESNRQFFIDGEINDLVDKNLYEIVKKADYDLLEDRMN